MDTQAVIFLVVMIAIGVAGLLAFLVFLLARGTSERGAGRRAAGAAPARGFEALLGPGLLAVAGVVVAIALLVWLLVAYSEKFQLRLEGDAGTIVFLVVMGIVAVGGLIAFVVFAGVRHARAPQRKQRAEAAAGEEGPPAQETPSAVRLLGLAALLLAVLILNWSAVEHAVTYRLTLDLLYPASLALALVLLFDKATRSWSYKGRIASIREWIFCDLVVFLFFLAYLNLLWSNAGEQYGSMVWDVIGIVLFFFTIWMLDRKATRLRFLFTYGYLMLLPIGLLIWAVTQDVPARLGVEQNPPITAEFVATVAQEAARQAAEEAVAALTQQETAKEDAEDEDAEEEAAEEEEAEITEQEVSWWSTIWPFFFLAIVFFALEVILLLAIRESDGSVTALIKDVAFVVLYVVLLLAALPGD